MIIELKNGRKADLEKDAPDIEYESGRKYWGETTGEGSQKTADGYGATLYVKKVDFYDHYMVYLGEHKNGVFHGHGKQFVEYDLTSSGDFHKRENYLFEGEFSGGTRSGHGIETWYDSDYWTKETKYEHHIEGEWRDDLKNGHFCERKTYVRNGRSEFFVGEYVNGRREGYGIERNGDLKDFPFDEAHYTGPGTEGQWHEGKLVCGFEGFWRDGKKAEGYEGSFSLGKYYKHGVKTYRNGDRYEGDFIDFHPNGWGVYIKADGSREEGLWDGGDLIENEEYDPGKGEPVFPEGFAEQLEGKSLKEQLRCFIVEKTSSVGSYSYGEPDNETKSADETPLAEYAGHMRSLVLKNGIPVGMRTSNGTLLLAGGPFKCTYYASEDDGTGSRSTSVYTRLKCRDDFS